MDTINEKYVKYLDHSPSRQRTPEQEKANTLKARKKVADDDILPFLIKYLIKIEAKVKELSEYIVNENKSDTDIISLI